MDSHDNNYLNTIEGKWLPIKHTIINSKGWQIHQNLLPYLKYGTVITKNTFGAKELFNYFEKYQYQQVELIGVVSNMCVLANAIIAKSCLPNADIIVNKKLIAAPNKKLHEETLHILQGMHIKVI
jgi:nicotinamidase-related amidase